MIQSSAKYFRTNIFMTTKQRKEFRKLASVTGIRYSELIRRAMNRFLAQQQPAARAKTSE